MKLQHSVIQLILIVFVICMISVMGSTYQHFEVVEDYGAQHDVVLTAVPPTMTLDPQGKLSVRAYGPRTPLMKNDKYYAHVVVNTSDHVPETLVLEGTYDPTVLRLSKLAFNKNVTVNENNSGNGIISCVAAFNNKTAGIIDIGHIAFDVISNEDTDKIFENVYDLGKIKITSDKNPYNTIIDKAIEYIDHTGTTQKHGTLSFIRGKSMAYPDPDGNVFRVIAPFKQVTRGEKFVCKLQVNAYDEFKDFTGRGQYDNTKIQLEEIRTPSYVDILKIDNESNGSLSLSASFKKDMMTKSLGFSGGPAIDICELVFTMLHDGKEDTVLVDTFKFGQNALTSSVDNSIVVKDTEHADHRHTFNDNVQLLFKAYRKVDSYKLQSLNTVRSYGPTIPLTTGDKYVVDLVLNAGIDIATNFEVKADYDPKLITLSTLTVPSYVTVSSKTDGDNNFVFLGKIDSSKLNNSSEKTVPLGTITFKVTYVGHEGDLLQNVMKFREVKVNSTVSPSDNIISKNIEHMDDRDSPNTAQTLIYTTKGMIADPVNQSASSTNKDSVPARTEDSPASSNGLPANINSDQSTPSVNRDDNPAEAQLESPVSQSATANATATATATQSSIPTSQDASESSTATDGSDTEVREPTVSNKDKLPYSTIEGYSLTDLVDKYPVKKGSPVTTLLIVLALIVGIPGLYFCMYYIPQKTPTDGIKKICGVAACIVVIVWAFSLIVTLTGLVNYATFDEDT